MEPSSHSRPWLADDNKDVDTKPGTQDPKGDPTREGVVEPKPLSAEPTEGGGDKPDVGSKSDRGGKVKPGGRS